jgi:hypothetical protein
MWLDGRFGPELTSDEEEKLERRSWRGGIGGRW